MTLGGRANGPSRGHYHQAPNRLNVEFSCTFTRAHRGVTVAHLSASGLLSRM